MRGKLVSPGRPSVAWHQERVAFWVEISKGEKTDVAAAAAGVSSPVGYRWFRHAGGVNPCLCATVSGRYMSFSERASTAPYKAQGAGMREIARHHRRLAHRLQPKPTPLRPRRPHPKRVRPNLDQQPPTPSRITPGPIIGALSVPPGITVLAQVQGSYHTDPATSWGMILSIW